MTKSLNIILFGETAVGKSSLVNLIAGKKIAETSRDAGLGTLTYEPYTFEVHGVSYTIWDIRGFSEAETITGAKEYLTAVKQAFKLIRELQSSGGVDLLVLCHREGRITTTTLKNYRLFYEVFCETKVPIAIVVTFLERNARMEDWWDQNLETLKKFEMVAATHACVTGLSEHPKSQESKQTLEDMLGQHDHDKKYNMPSVEWFRRFAQGWAKFHSRPKGVNVRELEKFLRKRCEVGIHDAHEIARILTEEDDTSGGSRKRKSFFGLF